MKSLIVFIVLLFPLTGITRQAIAQKEIKGIVTGFGNIPLNNVKVMALKSGNSALTDSTGQFSVLCQDKDVLEIMAGGFIKKKIKTGNETIHKVKLTYEYKESSFTAAVSNKHIGEENLQKAIYANAKGKTRDYSRYESIYELIAAEIYDVRVKGTVVTNYKIRSFDQAPQVLYVVDDKIVSDISYINPLYVKYIEFIDNVGATLYGSKGANGVLKITLK